MENLDDIIVLDGAKALDPNLFTQFCSYLQSDDERIDVYFTHEPTSEHPRVYSCIKNDLIDTAFGDEVANYCTDTDDEILVKCEKAVLRFVGQDVHWYRTNNRRLNKLRNAVNEKYDANQHKVEEPKVNKKAEYSVAMADLDMTTGTLCHIDFVRGTKAECLKWLNENIIRHTHFDETFVAVFNLHYEETDTEFTDKWKTLEELLADKKVVVE